MQNVNFSHAKCKLNFRQEIGGTIKLGVQALVNLFGHYVAFIHTLASIMHECTYGLHAVTCALFQQSPVMCTSVALDNLFKCNYFNL